MPLEPSKNQKGRYEALIKAIQEMSVAKEPEKIRKIATEAVCQITNCQEASFFIKEKDQCLCTEESGRKKLWKGKHFPMDSSISGWVIQNQEGAIVRNIGKDKRITAETFQDTFVQSLAIVPVGTNGAIGAYWPTKHKASTTEISLLESLAENTNIALNNAINASILKREIEELKLQQEGEGNESKFKGIFKYSSIGIVLGNSKGEFTEVNQVITDMLGYQREEVMGRSFADFTHPDDLETELNLINEIRENRRDSYRLEKRVIKKSGESLWTDVSVACNRNEDNSVNTFFAMIIDISENKRDKQIIIENEALYRQYFEEAPYAIFVTNPYFLSSPNRKAREMFGYSAEEMAKVSPYDLSPEFQPDGQTSKEKATNYIKKALSGVSQTFEWVHKRRDESLFYTEVSLFKVLVKGKEKILAIVLDISKQKEYFNEIKQKNAFIETILNNLPITLSIMDRDFNYVMVNKMMEQLSGIKSEDLIGKNPFDLYPYLESMGLKNLMMKAMNGEFVTTGDFKIPDEHSENKDHWFYSVMYPNRDANGEIIGIVAQTTDITNRKEFERKIVHQNQEYEQLNEALNQTNKELIKAKENAEQSNRLKTVFLNNMSHEIRTPMNGIMGFSHFLDNPELSLEKRKYYTNIINNCCKQLLRIIDDILEISRLETKQIAIDNAEFCLNDMLMELFAIYDIKSKERKIPLYLKKGLHDDESHIITDKTKLIKILGNIIENALKFTNEGFVEFGYYLTPKNIVLYVKDTGVGISPKFKKSIFERFVQEEEKLSRQFGGLGIGLSIAKENTELLKGKITVDSEKGKGSTFFISLPISILKNKVPSSSDPTQSQNEVESGYTILVAEDDEVNYLYVEALFEIETDQNYNLIHAKNGHEAINFCKENDDIDLVLMDVKMPLVNGYEATDKIKRFRPNLPIIAQTAYSTEEDKERALKSGCEDYISKPLDREHLFMLINKYLNVQHRKAG